MEKRISKYLCPVSRCNKRYTRPCLLRQHVLTHNNERPYTCPHSGCGKSFFRNSHLKAHSWTHSTQKPITCPICFKGFVTNQQLSRHEKTHTTQDVLTECEKDHPIHHSCLQCKDRDSKVSHMCPYMDCFEEFTSESLLTEHMLDLHIMSPILSSTEQQLPVRNQPESQCNSKDSFHTDNAPSWGDLNCKTDACNTFEPFEMPTQLIAHYDWDHAFVPESLYFAGISNEESDQSS